MNNSNNTKINEDNETYLVEINESTLVNEIFEIYTQTHFIKKKFVSIRTKVLV